MSTRILNAYRLPAGLDALSVLASAAGPLQATQDRLLPGAAATVASHYRQHVEADEQDPARETVNGLAYDVPRMMVRSHVEPWSRYVKRRRTIVEKILATLGVLAESNFILKDVDVTFTMVLLADPGDRTHVYAILYTARDEYHDAFVKVTGATSFDYWNNTDPAEGVSDAEWEHRKEVWGRVLGDDAPARRGLTWELPRSGLPFALVFSDMPHDLLLDELDGRAGRDRDDWEAWFTAS